MAWEGYRKALEEDPLGVAYVLGTTFKATAQRRAALPSLQTELAWCIERESGWEPSATNPGKTKATGLIQFIPSTAKKLGTTVDKLRQMSRVEQATYIQKFFDMNNRTMAAFGDVYLTMFYPSAVGKDNSFVIAAKDGPNVDVWEENKGLRDGPEGPITVGRVRQLGTPPTDALPGPQPAPPGKKKTLPPKPGPQPAKGKGWGGLELLLLGLAAYKFGFKPWNDKRRRRRAKR